MVETQRDDRTNTQIQYKHTGTMTSDPLPFSENSTHMARYYSSTNMVTRLTFQNNTLKIDF